MIISGMAYRIDLFAVFIFLGIVQAVFLSVFFFTGTNRKNPANIFFGCFLVTVTLCLLEIFLMYTGYIIHYLHLVDFSEAPALLIGPFLYLYIVAMVQGKVHRKRIALHTAFPLLYFLIQTPFLAASLDAKYNAWVGAYHPGLPFRDVIQTLDPRLFWLTDHHTELVLISLFVYVVLGSVLITRVFREKRESFISPQSATLATLRNGVVQIALFTVLIVIVKLLNEDDTGDHLFAAFASLIVYSTSISVMRSSGFFRQASLSASQKYKTSSLTPEYQKVLLEKLQQIMVTDKPFINPNFSQRDMARLLGASVHVFSQAINDGLNKNFFEVVAGYRVQEAMRLLRDQPNIKVEEIAEQVGYNSKSSFNTAFKKITGLTPSEYRSKD